MRKRKLVGLLVAAAVAALALAACGGGEETATLAVDMQDFSFNPSTYTVPAGSEVTITLRNAGTQEHEWVLFEQDYQIPPGGSFTDEAEGHILWEGEVEEPGGSETFTFTAPTEPGTYQVVCGIEGHFEEGMVGTFTVQ
jgi:uncharacterized cupredoxin-like copper-binding protein